jgi:RHS repeat-associated protein
LTSLTATADGTKTYGYDAVGNILINNDSGAGKCLYDSVKIHAVTNANGTTYRYDPCGNMLLRGSQTLAYNEENQLVLISQSGAPTVSFGYADGGARLWRNSSASGLTVWIGNLYEERDGRRFCHVFAGGRRIATFEPQGGLFSFVSPTPWICKTTRAVERAIAWPLQQGRAPVAVLIVTLTGILGFSIVFRRRFAPACIRVHRACILPFWQQAVSVWLIAGLVLATTNTNVQAQTYAPVFYYYHPDHLGSSAILTDRTGNRVQHYEYMAFGKSRYQEDNTAFSVSCRFTGQTFDDETGLYYYNARYYDPELGRFIQPDSVVPYPDNPQTLNRYTYVNNNPLKYTDPSGHIFGIDDIIIAIVIGAALGAATSAATGGDIGKGALSGAIGGIFGGLGGALGGVLGGSTGALAGAVVGGATGGAVSAAVTGGDVGMGALTGAIAGGIGWGVGWANSNYLDKALSDFSVVTISGSLGGGIGAVLQGGDFWQGAAYGARAAAAGYSMYQLVQNTPWQVKRSQIESQAGKDLDAVAKDGLDVQVNDFKYGHATNMSVAQRTLGVLAAPFLAAYGVAYEAWHLFVPGHTEYVSFYQSLRSQRDPPFYGFFDGQHPLNWLWDTPGDMLANPIGQFSGLFLSPSAAAQFNRIVFLIPGPNYTGGQGTWTKLATPGVAWPW